MPIEKPELNFLFRIDIDFLLGYIANFNEELYDSNDAIWIDIDDQVQYCQHIKNVKLDHSGIDIKIAVNDSIIKIVHSKEVINNTISGYVDFEKDHQIKTLEIDILGFEDRHMPLVRSNVSARCAIKIASIKFEHMNITKIFNNTSVFNYSNGESLGDTIFSCNGKSTFTFTTPIYKWLLEQNPKTYCN